MPAPLLAAGFDDTLLDNLVEILSDYSTQQVALDDDVGFAAERDRMTAPNGEELANGPIVVLYASMSNPAQVGGSRDKDVSTCTVQVDMYVAELEETNGGGDKKAMARLYYLKDQVRDALFAKSATDLGFEPGVVGKKRWGRFQVTPQPVGSEKWVCAGSWTFEVDYEFTPVDLDMVDLEDVNVTVKKSVAQAALYSTRWAGLYTVQGGP
jgi:hypothetical protein